MCGIAGLISDGPPLDPQLIETMSLGLAHRGPDGSGFAGWWLDGRCDITGDATALAGATVMLAHRRLAIIDPTPGAAQPYRSGDCLTAWNGEIYNYRELAGTGHAGGDTAMAADRLAARWSAALADFRGMWAIACLDTRRGRLLLARDPFGIKPLYLTRWRDGLAFASEPHVLLALPGVDRHADPGRMRDFLLDGAADHGGGTFYAGISQLPPGQLIELNLRTPSAWPTPTPAPTAPIAPDALDDLLHRSVALHLRSDAPLGFACSGGLDSTAIISLARRHQPDRVFHAIAFDDGEGRWIRMAAASAGCSLHLVESDDGTAAQALEGFLACQGEPPLSASMLAEYLVYRRAGEVGLKVLLDGQGADELFAGYDWFIGARLAGLLREGRVGAATAFAVRAPLGRHLRRRTVLADAWRAWFRRGPQRYRTSAPWLRLPALDLPTDGGHRPDRPLRAQLHWSLVRDTLPTFLRSTDRSAMAHGIENRVPFLLPEIAVHAARLTDDDLIGRDGTTKAALRTALRDAVPEAILDRRDKVGFTCPEGRWLRASAAWVRDTAGDPVVERIAWLDAQAFRAITTAFLAGSGPVPPAWWRTLVALDWMRRQGIAP